MSKKPRNKRHNLLQRYRNLAQKTVNEMFVAFVVDGDPRCDVIDAEGNKIHVDHALMNALEKVPYAWSVCCVVTCRTETGQQYMKMRCVDSGARYYKKDLTPTFNDIHIKLLKECNGNHVVTAGWVAAPRPFEFEDEFVNNVMLKLGGWKFPARWEFDGTDDEIDEINKLRGVL